MVIYRLLCGVTGKSYIGCTRQSLLKRLAGHRNASRSAGMKGMNLIAQAIRGHGWDNFAVETLSHARSIDELLEMEKAAIILHRTMHPSGYNQLAGGGGWVNRPNATGRPAWNKGVPHTEQARARMSQSRLGAKNYRARPVEFQGVRYECIKDCAAETNLTVGQVNVRIRKGLVRYLTAGVPGRYLGPVGVRPSLEARKKMSEAHSGANHYRARSIEIDGVVYPSILDASKRSGYSRMQLKTRLKDGRATYLTDSKYIFRENT